MRRGAHVDRASLGALRSFRARRQTPLWVAADDARRLRIGALHGLEPGHGKALLAFTLVGARATFKQALILAGALTFAHTIAVVLLGLLLCFAAGFATERLLRGSRSSPASRSRSSARARSRARSRTLAHRRPRSSPRRDHAHAHAIPGSRRCTFAARSSRR